MRILLLILLFPVLTQSQSILTKKKLHTRQWVNANSNTPPSELTVQVCDHRYDAVATFSQNTDRFQAPSGYYMEMKAFENNLRVGINAIRVDIVSHGDNGPIGMDSTGSARLDFYYIRNMWKNPVSSAIQTIVDYSSNTWTSTGASVYSGVTEGQSKGLNYPQHGHDMYIVSEGSYGFDTVNLVMGASNMSEFYGWLDFEKPFYESYFHRKATAGAYSNGVYEQRRYLLSVVLAMRTTSPGISSIDHLPLSITNRAYTYYGEGSNGLLGYPDTPFTRRYWYSYPSSLRWYDLWHNGDFTKEEADSFALQQLDTAIMLRGWYNEFTHWQTAQQEGNLDSLGKFFQQIRERIGDRFVWTCASSEAIEYLFLRECVSNVSAEISGNTCTVTATFQDPFEGDTLDGFPTDIPTSCLTIPVSLKIDFTGTALAGQDLVCSSGKMRNLGNNQYVFEMPFDSTSGQFVPVTIEPGIDGYFNEDLPTISTDITSNTLTVTTDMNTKAVLFSAATGSAETAFQVVARSNIYDTEHTFTLTPGNDYYIGVISEFKQMKLSSKISH